MDLLLIPTLDEARLILGGTVAGRLETTGLAEAGLEGASATAALCGFGLAAAGAGAAWWMTRIPDARRVVLAGVAGTYDLAAAPVGAVTLATSVACHGIGAGEGAAHRSAESLGWRQPHIWTGDGSAGVLGLATATLPGVLPGMALSVAAASSNPSEAAARRERHPEAVIEEMEGYAVALAARLANRELIMLRGVSNVAGVRDRRRWALDGACTALRAALGQLASRPCY
jgi:futalosine hydrolase